MLEAIGVKKPIDNMNFADDWAFYLVKSDKVAQLKVEFAMMTKDAELVIRYYGCGL